MKVIIKINHQIFNFDISEKEDSKCSILSEPNEFSTLELDNSSVLKSPIKKKAKSSKFNMNSINDIHFTEQNINNGLSEDILNSFKGNNLIDSSLLDLEIGLSNIEKNRYLKSNYSNHIYNCISKELGLDRSYYFLKYKDIELINDENLSKIFDENETSFIDFNWNDFIHKFVKIDIDGKTYNLPYNIANESLLIKECLDNTFEESTVVFKNECLKKENIINEWIKISTMINQHLKYKNESKISIPSPIVPGVLGGNKDNLLDLYIGKSTNLYLNSLSLNRLKDLVEAFDYLGVENIIESICANIAVRFIYGKSIEDIKKLNLI